MGRKQAYKISVVQKMCLVRVELWACSVVQDFTHYLSVGVRELAPWAGRVPVSPTLRRLVGNFV